MAVLSMPLALRRPGSRRRNALEYLSMAAVTVVVFVVLLLVIERVTDTPLVSRIFEGTIAARTRADYSVTLTPRIKPVRSTIAASPTPGSTAGASR